MKIVIIDDEKPARENLKTILNQFFPTLDVIGEADSVANGVELLSQVKADLVFLDINLFDGSGFNILQELEEIDFQVIFVTAYSQFAIRAFRVNALDYILKPINVDELKIAVNKAITSEMSNAPSPIQTIVASKTGIFKNERLAIKENDGIRFVDITSILRCKSDNNYTEIHLLDGKKIISSKTLKDYSQILEDFDFLRIHQSHLVNTKKIKRIIKKDGLFVEMDNGELLQVSRRKKDDLYRKMTS
ncbi:MAG: response regulator [Crocinitomix sp.]|nr:response regulator [Crocinitomix sp.]